MWKNWVQSLGWEDSLDCIVHGVTKSWTQLSDLHFHFHFRACYASPLLLSWVRCFLWTGKEREYSSLDPGPWAITEMVKLDPSSLGHIYREGSIQSLWRPVLSGVPGAGSTGLWETPGASFPAPRSAMAHWELKVGHRGIIYSAKVNKRFSHLFFSLRKKIFSILSRTPLHCLIKPLLCPVSVSLLQFWSWDWSMEITAVRGEWKWNIKENGAQWMIWTGTWMRRMWCADSWGVELLLMLPQGLNLGWELDPFGLIIFTARDQSQLSLSVVILLLKTIVLRAFPTRRMLGQSAHISSVRAGRGFLAGQLPVLFPEYLWAHGSHPLECTWVNIQLTQWFLEG